MTLKILVEKLARRNSKFITGDEIRENCRKLPLDYYTTIRYLTHYKYIARIFRGIFYVYSIEERKLRKINTPFYDILKEALKMKGIDNWYFGLETALKFNNLTHEYFVVDYVISDKLFRAKSFLILGRKVKFVKLSKKMLSFGIIKNNFNYSDSEKTLLDLLYLKHYSKSEFIDVVKKLSKSKLIKYSKNYNQQVILAVGELK